MSDVQCPFCGCDPYEYVDIGVGHQPVAVTCCELGIEYFDHRRTSETVEIDRGEFDKIAQTFSAMRLLGLTPPL